MSTTFGSFEDFWAAMSRLYDRQLKHDEQIAELGVKIGQLRDAQELTNQQIVQLNQQMQATDARLDRTFTMIATLAGAVAKQAEEIESHERRLERLEGTA